ncbi:MAG: metallophosphoesterase [Ilumatobacteraceae bacterium]
MDITTVADDLIVAHHGTRVITLRDLRPGTTYTIAPQDGDSPPIEVTTLDRPSGELLCRLATVNDVHFGETGCGQVDDDPGGPIIYPEPGEPPYPETMNRGAVAEMVELDSGGSPLAAVIVKGDLSNDGQPAEWAAFEACYRPAFGPRLHVVRGNHDAYRGQHEYAGDEWIELPGLAVALIDTAIAHSSTGTISADQIEWLDAHAASADRPVIVMGHHQQWIDPGRGSAGRSDDYFGLHPDASDALDAVAGRRPRIIAYTAGHTHRHRVREMACGIPSVEVGCVKDFPGTWAEYRVYEGGVTQVVHRISTPQALHWSERCRHLYSDFGMDYSAYALGGLEERCFNIELR